MVTCAEWRIPRRGGRRVAKDQSYWRKMRHDSGVNGVLSKSPARRRWAVPLLAATGVVVAAAGVLVWSAPRADITDPGPDATPVQVVQAYVAAVAARDFDTANFINARPGSDLGRFSRPMYMDHLKVSGTQIVGREAYVRFTADYHRDNSLTDGQEWGYVLMRGRDEVWHITSAGVA